MIRSIFTRDMPGTSDMAVAEALADAELVFGDQTPTGTYVDMTSNLPVVQPEAVKSPVLLIRGEHDGIATMADLQDFFGRLPNGDKQFVSLSHAAHALHYGLNRAQFWHAVHAFLAMPARGGLRQARRGRRTSPASLFRVSWRAPPGAGPRLPEKSEWGSGGENSSLPRALTHGPPP